MFPQLLLNNVLILLVIKIILIQYRLERNQHFMLISMLSYQNVKAYNLQNYKLPKNVNVNILSHLLKHFKLNK